MSTRSNGDPQSVKVQEAMCTTMHLFSVTGTFAQTRTNVAKNPNTTYPAPPTSKDLAVQVGMIVAEPKTGTSGDGIQFGVHELAVASLSGQSLGGIQKDDPSVNSMAMRSGRMNGYRLLGVSVEESGTTVTGDPMHDIMEPPHISVAMGGHVTARAHVERPIRDRELIEVTAAKVRDPTNPSATFSLIPHDPLRSHHVWSRGLHCISKIGIIGSARDMRTKLRLFSTGPIGSRDGAPYADVMLAAGALLCLFRLQVLSQPGSIIAGGRQHNNARTLNQQHAAWRDYAHAIVDPTAADVDVFGALGLPDDTRMHIEATPAAKKLLGTMGCITARYVDVSRQNVLGMATSDVIQSDGSTTLRKVNVMLGGLL